MGRQADINRYVRESRTTEISNVLSELNDTSGESMARVNDYINRVTDLAQKQAYRKNVSGKGYESYIHTIVIGRLKGYINKVNVNGKDSIGTMYPIVNRDLPYDNEEEVSFMIVKLGTYRNEPVMKVRDILTNDVYNISVPKNDTWKDVKLIEGSTYNIRFDRDTNARGTVCGRLYHVV